VLFGSIERDARSRERTDYDVVVTVSGPRADMVTRRKGAQARHLGQVDSRQFVQVPTYLAVFSSRPSDEIAPPDVRRRSSSASTMSCCRSASGRSVANVVASDPFRSAFVRLRTEHGLYREQPRAVTFLTPTLFRTGIPLPAEVAIGTYDVDIKLFAGVARCWRGPRRRSRSVKVGFEQFRRQRRPPAQLPTGSPPR